MDAIQFLWGLARNRDDYRRPVIPLLMTFCAGLLCGEHLFLPSWFSGLILLACLSVILLTIIRKQAAAITPLIFFFVLGWFCMAGFTFPILSDNHIIRLTGETPWTITGTIIDTPVCQPGRQVLFVKPLWLDNGRRHIRADGNLRVTVYGTDGPKLPYGALIRFQSRIRKITNFKNPGSFNYERYMAFQDVFGMAYANANRVKVLPTNDPVNWRSLVQRTRQSIAGLIEKSCCDENAAILKALVIGRQTDLTPEVRESFSRAGVSHLLAISGLHVGIIAGLVFFVFTRILTFIPFFTWYGWVKKSAALCTLPCVISYGLLAGMSPSTQRAVTMTTVFLLALVAGKRHQLTNTLALAALIILAVHPPSLYAVSFQLSFAAVFFILTGMGALEGPLNCIENKWFKRGTGFVLVSFFALIGTSPLTAHYFNQISWAGLFTNCLLIPLVGFVVVPLGLGGATLSGINPDLALILFKLDDHLLSMTGAITETIAGLPNVAFKTVTPNAFEIILYYALIWAVISLVKHYQCLIFRRPDEPVTGIDPAVKTTAIIAIIAILSLILDAGYWINRRWLHDDLRITVLDVGQGNAALVELPGGKCLLIDGGGFTGSSTFDVGKMIVAPSLWRNKIGTVDTLILTHADTDHLGGLIYIAENFHVKTVWSSGEPVNTQNFHRFLSVVKKKRIEIPNFSCLAKNRIIDGVRFELLYPPDDFMRLKQSQGWRNTNNNSLVTRISIGKVSFLFPGDIMEKGERELTIQAGEHLESTVLIAPHHGSRTSSTAFFLSCVKPETIVISAGRHNRFSCPCPDVLNRYTDIQADIFRTDLDGAVVMSTRGNKLKIRTPMRERSDKIM